MPELVARHAAAFGAWVRAGRHVRSCSRRDSRHRARCSAAAAAGFQSAGVDVMDLGMVPDADGAAGGGDHDARRGIDGHREPQSDRMERAQVRRAGRRCSSTRRPEPRCFAWRTAGRRRAGWDAHRAGAPSDAGRGRPPPRRDPRPAVARRRGDSRAAVPGGPRLRARRGGRSCRRCSTGSGCEVTASTSSPTGGSRASRSRSRRTSGSWASWCARPEPTRASRWTPTWTVWRWWTRPGRPIGEDYTLAFAVRAVLARAPKSATGRWWSRTSRPAWWWRTPRGTAARGSSGPRSARPTWPGPSPRSGP